MNILKIGWAIVSSFWSDYSFFQAHRDLKFVYQTIYDNHPGVYNAQDPDFKATLRNGYYDAKNKIWSVSSADDRRHALCSYLESFHDGHLRVSYRAFSQNNATTAQPKKELSIAKLASQAWLITIPSFALSEQEEAFNALLQSLETLRDSKVICFDVRGNGGGSSFYAQRIVEILFGDECAQRAIERAKKDEYVEWRASSGNIAYLSSFAKEWASYGPSDPRVIWANSTISTMNDALQRNQRLVTVKDTTKEVAHDNGLTHDLKSKIYILIDQGCASATLDFIDRFFMIGYPITLVGKPTNIDTVYMDIQRVVLPSNAGYLVFPMKIYRNRYRGDNKRYEPNIPIEWSENEQENRKTIESILDNKGG